MANDPVSLPFGTRKTTASNGGSGSGVDNVVEINFSYSSPSSLLIWSAEAGNLAVDVKLSITEIFDGIATIKIGEPGTTDRLMKITENDPYELGVYATTPAYTYPGTTEVRLYLNISGSTQGQGKVIIITD